MRIIWWLRERFRAGRRLSAPKHFKVIYDRKI